MIWGAVFKERGAVMDLKKYIHGFQRQDQDGIWQDTQGKEVSGMFSNQLQDRLFALEDQSWWFRYRAGVICMFAAKYLRKDRDIFDVGGGTAIRLCVCRKKDTRWLCWNLLTEHASMR